MIIELKNDFVEQKENSSVMRYQKIGKNLDMDQRRGENQGKQNNN